MTARARHRRPAPSRGLVPALLTVAVVAAVLTVGGGDAPRAPAPGSTRPTAQAQVPAAVVAVAPVVAPSAVASPAVAPPAVAPSVPAASPLPTAPPRAAAAGPAPVLERSRPVRLQVPSLDLDTSLVDLGLAGDGTLEVPPGATPAGWYVGSPSPGQLGPAVLAGHVDYGGAAGVFAQLHRLRPGAELTVTRTDGRDAVFRVTRVDRVDKDEFPTDEVYGDLDHAGLRLITCGGRFSRASRSYDDNVIAYAELVRTL